MTDCGRDRRPPGGRALCGGTAAAKASPVVARPPRREQNPLHWRFLRSAQHMLPGFGCPLRGSFLRRLHESSSLFLNKATDAGARRPPPFKQPDGWARRSAACAAPKAPRRGARDARGQTGAPPRPGRWLASYPPLLRFNSNRRFDSVRFDSILGPGAARAPGVVCWGLRGRRAPAPGGAFRGSPSAPGQRLDSVPPARRAPAGLRAGRSMTARARFCSVSVLLLTAPTGRLAARLARPACLHVGSPARPNGHARYRAAARFVGKHCRWAVRFAAHRAPHASSPAARRRPTGAGDALDADGAIRGARSGGPFLPAARAGGAPRRL